MAAYLTRQEIHEKLGQGLGMAMPVVTAAGAIGTAAALASGFINVSILSNSVGSTFPGTLVSFPFPPAPSAPISPTFGLIGNMGNRSGLLARLYRIGTLNLAATGNQFTHDSATFPLLRTEFGETNKPISLIPLIQVTTALTTTAATLRLRNATGPASGYTNQDGTAQTGNIDFTFPSATTAANSTYVPMLNVATSGLRDSGVRDVSNIDVTTAAGAGAATIWGMEPIMPLAHFSNAGGGFTDAVMSGMLGSDTAPAVPTAGTLTSLLAFIQYGTPSPIAGMFWLEGVEDA